MKGLPWFRITTWAVVRDKFIVQLSLQRLKINNKAMRTIKGEKGKVTDNRKKMITSVPNTSEWKSYSEE